MRAITKHQSATWASDVHTFCPSMTHSSPSSSALVGDVGEVGAGAGLGVALAPELVDGEDPRQEALLLLRGAERDQRRAEQLLAEVVDPAGASARAYSSWKITCCTSGSPRPPCSSGQPMQVQPAAARCRSQASRSSKRLVLAARPAQAAQLGEVAGEVVRQPGADLGAERLGPRWGQVPAVGYPTKHLLG